MLQLTDHSNRSGRRATLADYQTCMFLGGSPCYNQGRDSPLRGQGIKLIGCLLQPVLLLLADYQSRADNKKLSDVGTSDSIWLEGGRLDRGNDHVTHADHMDTGH